MNSLLEQLDKEFPKQVTYHQLNPSNIDVLSEPSEFYELLLKSIDVSKRRIAISALYLGTGDQERRLFEAIEKKLQTNKEFKVELYLDFNRSTRKNSDKTRSVDLIEPLLKYPNFKVLLYQYLLPVNYLLAPLTIFSSRLSEVGSTLHIKSYIFDDDIILSGASLSQIYFKNRQDRYLHLKDCPDLAQFMCEILRCLGSKHSAATSIETLNKLMSKWKGLPSKEDYSTVAIPIVQHGPSKLDQDMRFMKLLPRLTGNSASSFRLSSGYFNPPKDLENIVRNANILAPGEQTNGFYGATGFSAIVPQAYNFFYREFIQRAICRSFRVYERPGWTFHAKGVWVDLMPNFYLTSVGSSNYNYRSYCRDFELQLILITKDEHLASKLRQESDKLWSKTRLLEKVTDVPPVRPYIQMIARMLRSFL